MKPTSDPHDAFLSLLENPPAEGPLSTLLGPTPCTTPEELEQKLPSKIRYVGPGPWYAYLKVKYQED